MCAPSPPKPPDYAAQAQVQGVANRQAGLETAILSNPNIINPYGSRTVSYDYLTPPGGAPTDDGFATTQATAPYGPGGERGILPNAARMAAMQAGAGGYGGGGYGGDTLSMTGVPQATITEELSETGQQQFDAQNRIINALNTTAEAGLGRVGTAMATPFPGGETFQQAGTIDLGALPEGGTLTTEGLPDYSRVDPSTLQQVTPFNAEGLTNIDPLTTQGLQGLTGIDPSQLQQVAGLGTEGLQGMTGVDLQQLQQVTGLSTADLQGMTPLDLQQLTQRSVSPSVGGRQDVIDALRARAAPRFAQERSALEADLMARGFNPGGEGYDARMLQQQQGQTDFDIAAILAGGQEQSRIADLESRVRGQDLGEQQARLAAESGIRGQTFAERQAVSQFEQSLRAQGLNEQQIQAAVNQSMRGQQFGERESVSQFEQSLRAQGLNEQQVQAAVNQSMRGQQFGERQAIGAQQERMRGREFGERAAISAFEADLRSQGLTEQMVQTEVDAAIRSGQFGERGAIAGFEEGQRGARLTEQQAQAGMDADVRARQIQEEQFFRNIPLNELNALRTGGMPNVPQFQPYQGVNIGAAPVFDAALAQGNFDLQNYQNQGPGLFSTLAGGALGAAGAAGGFGNLFDFSGKVA